MSYMDFPRIHFGGTFEAGPSTINNVPENYKPGQSPLEPVWNPWGNAYIKLIGCTVTSALTDMNGTQDTGLSGGPVTSTDNWGSSGVPAKIVDLDPEQQMVSMIYGLQLKVGSGDNYVIADMTAIWFQNYFGTNAAYQSVLTPVEWGSQLSGVIQQWNETSSELLSIRFVAGPPVSQRPPQKPTDSSPFICEIIGTIGPGDPDQPISFVPARLLRPSTPPSFRNRGRHNFGPAQVATDSDGTPVRLTIDLGQSVPRADETLTVWAEKSKDLPVKIGSLDFSQANRSTNALVTDFDLSNFTKAEMHQLLNGPITVRDESGDSVYAESSNGLYVDAFPYVFRLAADSTQEVCFWATRFGAPADVPIVLADATATKLPLGASEPPRVGVVGPGGEKASFDREVTTQCGVATAQIHGGDPANFRQYIDGQVYALSFAADPPADDQDPNAFLSLLVHDRFDKEPTWENIQPIMQQYEVLYPVMKTMGIELGNEKSLQKHKPGLLRVFGLPIENPAYMPVVRDLSAAKQAAIVAWLEAQPDPE